MGDLKSLLARWRAEPSIGGNVTAWQEQAAILGTYADLPINIEPRLAQAFARLGYKQLYSHQQQSWDLLREGKNVAVVAGTASGKTLCYNLPVLDSLLKDPQGRALYLFPTKALANDQSNSLNTWLSAIGSGAELVAAVYDGDTPASSRTQIRDKARIILSNPDMLHIGVLPYHTRWADFFANLRYVVLDEMHIYRGVFGSHQANVLRRLQRLCAFYGSYPQFIFASATISNAKQLAEKLIEQPVELVEKDGAPHGSRTFLVYNPPVVNKDLGIRASVLQESVQLASEILTQDVQTIVFGRTRRMIELMLTNLRTAVDQTPDQIRGYRSGYLKGERREIEKGLRSGDVRAVVATTALELGVDIGGLDAAVLAGYPGTIAATRQQAGRAGRSDKHALVVMLMQSNPLEQFLARHPEYFLRGNPEQALINPNNLLILLSHIRCAAFELPFKDGDSFGSVDGDQVKDFLEVLVGQGQIHQSGGKYFWMSEKYPALEVSLRGTGAGSVVLQSQEDGEWKLIGDVDPVGAHSLVHPEAIYIHEGRTYFVDELNLGENIARMHPVEVDYYTVPVHKVTIELVEKKEEAAIAGGLKQFGQLLISDQVHRYERIHWTSNEAPGGADLDLPPITLNTFGYWFLIDQKTTDLLRERGLWRNDPNDYGENWPQQKLLVRARDQYRCKNCGATEDGRVHDVHHRTPFRTFRNYKDANQLENLITLCPACHRQAETVVKVRSGLAGLSFVLSHLAPLFIMCDPHNIGVSSDPKSDLAEGEPAIVIYDNVPDGIGLSQRLYEIHDELMLRAHEIVAACECADGCLACVGPGGEQGESSKKETLALLELLAQKVSTL